MKMSTLEFVDMAYKPQGKPYVLRAIRGADDLDQVYRLTHDSLVHAGSLKPQPDGMLSSYAKLDASASTVILIALQDGEVIGTNSVTADGPLGLHTDIYFPNETQTIRQEKKRLVSSYRIATAPGLRTALTTSLIMDLVRFTCLVAQQRFQFETMLCAFNPKHETVYQRLLNAQTIAHLQKISHVDIATGVVLMRIESANLPPRFVRDVASLSEQQHPR